MIEPKIDHNKNIPHSFINGLAQVTENNGKKWGYIDINGDFIWEPTE